MNYELNFKCHHNDMYCDINHSQRDQELIEKLCNIICFEKKVK